MSHYPAVCGGRKYVMDQVVHKCELSMGQSEQTLSLSLVVPPLRKLCEVGHQGSTVLVIHMRLLVAQVR